MSNLQTIKLMAVAGVVSIALGTVLLPTKALAWHPVGKITKFVANETTGGPSVDANTNGAAVEAKAGDTLRYTITVRNDGNPGDTNDLAFIVIDDTLPTGVELVGNPAQRTIKESIPGVVKPGKSVTKEYKVRVTSKEDAKFVKNTACFKGDSTVKDNAQEGCDDAIVKIKKVEEPKTPETPKTPEQPKAPATPAPSVPAQLPSTGPEAILAGLIGTGAIGYSAYNYRRSKQAVTAVLKK